MKTIIAIDPGASGAIAIRIGDTVTCHNMPETPQDAFALLGRAGESNVLTKAFMEEVSGFAGEDQPGSRMFNFGRGFGQLEGMLIGLRIPFELVRPQRWQRALALGTAGRQKAIVQGLTPEQAATSRKRVMAINYIILRDWKHKLKENAQRLYPRIQVTLSNCDALLILEYGRRFENLAHTMVQPPQQ